jgi:hypothetical protein
MYSIRKKIKKGKQIEGKTTKRFFAFVSTLMRTHIACGAEKIRR